MRGRTLALLHTRQKLLSAVLIFFTLCGILYLLLNTSSFFIPLGFLLVVFFAIFAFINFSYALLIGIFIAIVSPTQAQIDPGYPFPIITLTRAVIGILVIVWVLKMAREKRNVLKELPLRKQFAFYMGVFFLSAVLSPFGRIPLFQFLSLTMERFLLFLMVYSVTVKERHYHAKILNTIILSLFLLACLGIIEKKTYGWNPVQYLPPPKREILVFRHTFRFFHREGIRAMATAPHAIALGGMLALGVPVVFFNAINARAWKKRLFYFLVLSVFPLCIYYTHSRGPWAMLGIEILYLGLSEKKTRKWLILLILLFITGMIIRPGVYYTIRDTLRGSFGRGILAGSTEYRKAILFAVWDAVKRNPLRLLFGYGEGTGRFLGLTGYVLGRKMTFYAIDNGYAHVLLHEGLLGLLAFLILIGSVHLYISRSLKTYPYLWICKSFLGILWGLYFILYTIAFLDWHQPAYLFWTLLGAVLGCIEKERRKNEKGSSIHREY